MGGQKTLAVMAAILFISQLAAARPSHENYDDADVNLNAIVYYFQSSFDVLNDTLVKIAIIELDQAVEDSSDFSNMIDGMRTTLSSIPEDVDSYEPLEYMVGLVGAIDINLSILIVGFEMTIGSIDGLSEYRFDTFEIGPISENLSVVDLALIEFDHGLQDMERGRSLVGKDLSGFRNISWPINLTVEEETLKIDLKLKLLQDISDTMTILEENRSSVDEVISKLMHVPVNDLHVSLTDIIKEGPIDPTLGKDIDVMEAANTGLSEGMEAGIETVKDQLDDTWGSIQALHEEQKVFLENITLLEIDLDSTISEKIIQYESCLRSIEGMNEELFFIRSVYDELEAFDDGTIADDIGLLEIIVQNYSYRLDNITIFEPDLGGIVNGLESILISNIISVDLNDDGNLSGSEVEGITLGNEPFEYLDQTRVLLDQMILELALLPKGYFINASMSIPLLERAMEICRSFSIEHNDTINRLKELNRITRTLQEDIFELMACYQKIVGLEVLMQSLNRTFSELNDVGIELDTTWEFDLIHQFGLYNGFLDSLEHLIMEPIIMIELDRGVAPYDTTILYHVLAIDIDPMNGTYYPDERNISISLDDTVLDNISLDDGRASGEFLIERKHNIGPHFLNVSMIAQNGNITNGSSELRVRKLQTSITLDLDSIVVLHGSEIGIQVSVDDELGRTQEFNVTVGPDMIKIWTPSRFDPGIVPLGYSDLDLRFAGNDHFDGSNTTIGIFTYREPSIILSANGTDFGYNDTIGLSIDMEIGNGSLMILMNDIEFGTFNITEGEISNITIDPYDMGNGTYLFKAYLSSSDEWTIDGWSNAILIRVDLTIPSDPDPPSDDINDTIIDDDGENDPPMEEDILIQWITLALVTIIVLIVSVLLIFIRKKKRKETSIEADEPFHLPKIYIRRRKKIVVAEEAVEKRLTPITRRTQKHAFNMEREELISYYLDVIERSPYELGLSNSMTPREISRQLRANGLDPVISDRISEDFEWSIYKLGSPERETLTRYKDDHVKVKGWFGSFLKRIGLSSSDGEVNN